MAACGALISLAAPSRRGSKSSRGALPVLAVAAPQRLDGARGGTAVAAAVVADSAAAARAAPAVAPPAVPSFTDSRPTISRSSVRELERELDGGSASVPALRRFHALLEQLPAGEAQSRLGRVWPELCVNLESFNAVFTAVLLKVQCTLGRSDYERRDAALQCLIQPLAGEYGLAPDVPLGRTHRRLFAEFYASVTGRPLASLLADGAPSPAADAFFAAMLRDVSSAGCEPEADVMRAASYALGYNLAVEYLAAYEKTWMLDAFRVLHSRVLGAEGRSLDWTFLEVHAVGEPLHAELGHDAVTAMVPDAHKDTLRRAMWDHDRDFAVFYNALSDALEA